MYKLVMFLLFGSFFMLMISQQTDEQFAMHTLFRAKHAVNRAAHAAAQQIDAAALAEGRIEIDLERARDTALRYLQANMQLDEALRPLPGSFLQEQVVIDMFDIVNDADAAGPVVVSFPDSGESVMFRLPGVALQVGITYTPVFSSLKPVIWQVKGAAELTEP